MPALTTVPDVSPPTSPWRDWLEAYGPRLLLFARQQTRSQEDAKDVFQDALVKLVEKVRSGDFIGGQEAWPPYLYTTIRRLAIDLSRSSDRRSRREDFASTDAEYDAYEPFQPWFEGDPADHETRQQLEERLKELPTKFSEVIVMKIWADHTFADIAEILGISPNTAASRYRYGLEALKKSLSNARRRGDISI